LFVGNTCIVFSGWAVPIQTNDDSYELATYDGNIDFFKILDNITFEEIPFPELLHTKDLPTIKDNWEIGNAFYAYLAADYNGLTHYVDGTTNYLNIDYLIPSVSISFLWQRIFETFGFTYSGSIFQEAEFKDTFLTLPKGQVAGEISSNALSASWTEQKVWPISHYVQWLMSNTFAYTTDITAGQMIDNTANSNMKAFQVAETGLYRITVTGYLWNYSKKGVYVRLRLGRNLENLREQDISYSSLQDPKYIIADSEKGEAVSFDETFNVTAGETFTILYYAAKSVDSDNSRFELDFLISKINQESVDQIKFFKGLSPKDFYKEVMWRFGLTPFPSKDKNHIEFLTWEERMNTPVQDWSSRFNKSLSEKYVYEGYAKNNYFRFKYNGEGDDFNDGVIKIENENLEDRVIVINSKTYSVERLPVEFQIGSSFETLPKMELWEKEIKVEDGVTTIEYKPRDSRFTFLQSDVVNVAANIGSQQLGQFGTVNKVRTARNWTYSQQEIIERRYRKVRELFKNTLIVTAEFTLSDAEFNAFDLKPVVYVKQRGGNFLVNKITKPNLEDKTTQAELIKINKL
jgi:hypothetical protein